MAPNARVIKMSLAECMILRRRRGHRPEILHCLQIESSSWILEVLCESCRYFIGLVCVVQRLS